MGVEMYGRLFEVAAFGAAYPLLGTWDEVWDYLCLRFPDPAPAPVQGFPDFEARETADEAVAALVAETREQRLAGLMAKIRERTQARFPMPPKKEELTPPLRSVADGLRRSTGGVVTTPRRGKKCRFYRVR